MYISLNELRQRVTILRPVTVEDGAGNLIRQGEEEVCTVWAKVFPYAAKISDGYAEKVDEVNYRIIIRWRNGLILPRSFSRNWARRRKMPPKPLLPRVRKW